MALSTAAAPSLLPPPPKPTSALIPLHLHWHAFTSNPSLGSRIRKTSHISWTNPTKFAIGVLRTNNGVPELASASTTKEEEEEAEASTSSEVWLPPACGQLLLTCLWMWIIMCVCVCVFGKCESHVGLGRELESGL